VIATDSGVILGSRENRFVLGPASIIVANEVVIEAEILSVDSGKVESLASFIASENISVSGRLSIECPDRRSFVVFSNSPVPALRAYVRPQGERPFFADYGKLVDLRKLILAFRSSIGGGPGVFGELLEKRIIKTNSTRQRYLRRLRELEIVFAKGSQYYLNTNTLANYGINFSDLHKGEPTEQIVRFLQLLDAD
jgi:hypothetical protein